MVWHGRGGAVDLIVGNHPSLNHPCNYPSLNHPCSHPSLNHPALTAGRVVFGRLSKWIPQVLPVNPSSMKSTPEKDVGVRRCSHRYWES